MRHRIGVFVTSTLLALILSSSAQAAPIQFATFSSGIGPALIYDTATLHLGSFVDPAFFNSAPVVFAQNVPPVAPALAGFNMTTLSPFAVVPEGIVYGPGAFSIGVPNPDNTALIPLLTANFDSAVFAVNPALVLANLGSTAFGALSFVLSGLDLPGSFVFTLGTPLLVPDTTLLILPIADAKVYADAQVPEPGSLLLLGAGVCAAAWRRRARTRI